MAKKANPFGVPRKSRHCKNFDKDGKPTVEGGCPRSSLVCHFIHPDDPEWRGHRGRFDDESYFNPRQSSSRFNEDERARDQGWGNRSSRGGPLSPVFQTKAPPVFVPAAASLPPTPVAPPLLPKIDTNFGSVASEQSVLQTNMETDTPVSPEYQFAPTPLLGPPPTVPDAPGFEDIDILGSAPDIVSDERKKMWLKRVRILADAVKAYQAHRDAQEEKLVLDGLEGRPGLSLGSEAGETILEIFRNALREQSEEEAKLKTTQDKLVHELASNDARGSSESAWPFSLAQMEEEFEKRERYNEIVVYIRDLRSTALKIWQSLDEEVKKNAPPPEVPALSQMPEEEQAPGEAMEVDEQAQPEGTQQKKRKLNDGSAEDIIATLLEKILALDESVTKLEKRRQEEEERMLNSVDEMIDIRLQELQEKEPEIEFRTEDLGPATQKHLADISEGIVNADTQVRKVASEMEDYAKRLNTLIVDYPAAVKAYNEALRQHEENQSRISELFTEQTNSEKAITALQNGFRAVMARPEHQQFSPPASPALPSCEVIVEAVEEGLRESLRAGLREEVESFRRDVTARMEEEVNTLIVEMMGKVGQTVGIIGRISDRLEEVPGLQR